MSFTLKPQTYEGRKTQPQGFSLGPEGLSGFPHVFLESPGTSPHICHCLPSGGVDPKMLPRYQGGKGGTWLGTETGRGVDQTHCSLGWSGRCVTWGQHVVCTQRFQPQHSQINDLGRVTGPLGGLRVPHLKLGCTRGYCKAPLKQFGCPQGLTAEGDPG